MADNDAQRAALNETISMVEPVVNANCKQLERLYPGYEKQDSVDARILKDVPKYESANLMDEFIREFETVAEDRFPRKMFKRYFLQCFSKSPAEKAFLHQRFILNNVHAEWSEVKASMISEFLDQALIQQREIDFGNFSPLPNERVLSFCKRFLHDYRAMGRDPGSVSSKTDIHLIAKWIPTTTRQSINVQTNLRGAQTIKEFCKLAKALDDSAFVSAPSALAKQKPSVQDYQNKPGQVNCLHHGWGNHSTKQCKVLKPEFQSDDTQKSETPSKRQRTAENICTICNKVPFSYKHLQDCRAAQAAQKEAKSPRLEAKTATQSAAQAQPKQDDTESFADEFYSRLEGNQG